MRRGCPQCHLCSLTCKNSWFTINSLLKDGDIKNTLGMCSVHTLFCWLPAITAT